MTTRMEIMLIDRHFDELIRLVLPKDDDCRSGRMVSPDH